MPSKRYRGERTLYKQIIETKYRNIGASLKLSKFKGGDFSPPLNNLRGAIAPLKNRPP